MEIKPQCSRGGGRGRRGRGDGWGNGEEESSKYIDVKARRRHSHLLKSLERAGRSALQLVDQPFGLLDALEQLCLLENRRLQQ